jgi:predicted RNA binding protein YcfA (HicA-like mRNA interferase family)
MGTFGVIKQSAIIKFLEANDFVKDRQAGSHAIYYNASLHTRIVIPFKKDTQHYVIKQIMRIFNLSANELKNKLKDF